MEVVLLIARLSLAGVFVVAAIAKLLDRPASREALVAFGVPSRLATPLSRGLPVVELIVAAALVPAVSAWWGGLAGLALLVAFTAVIVRSLARGARPDCRCFGQVRPAPIGGPTLVRNGVFIALAAFVVGAGWSDPGPSALGWLAAVSPEQRPAVILGLLAVALLAAVLGILLGGVLVKQTQLLARLSGIESRLDELEGRPVERPEAAEPDRGLPIGAPAPAFTLPDLAGETRSLASLLAHGRPVLLLFVASDCQPCAALIPSIVAWRREHAHTVTLALVAVGRAEDIRRKFGELADTPVLLQAASEVADVYAPGWTPAAVLVTPAGRLASFASYGDQAIGELVSRAAAAPAAPIPPNGAPRHGTLPIVSNGGRPGLGQAAPAVVLPDLQGQTVDLRDYRGRETVVVFWNPGCEHCQQLAEDLRRWEAEPPRGAPRLLVISSGSIEANRAFGFRSAVALDEGFKVAKAFGVEGTPSAVIVDSEGRIASTVGTGARDVLALAGVPSAVERPPVRPEGG